MSVSDYGSCVSCGFDLNGEWIYDFFLERYKTEGRKAPEVDAMTTASMYGAGRGYGRFGKCVYVKRYDENYKKLLSYYQCPECKEECYVADVLKEGRVMLREGYRD